MNGLMKSSKLGDVGSFGALAIAAASMSAVVYVLFAGLGLA